MILSWKCQGLGNPWRLKTLRDVIRAEKSGIALLMETRLMSTQMNRIKVKLAFDWDFCGLCWNGEWLSLL